MAEAMQVGAVRRVIDELGVRVGEARAAYGDIPAVQRLANDVERLRIDARELNDLGPTVPSSRPPVPHISIDDAPVDPSLWVDADDEGVGGFHGPHR
ncbi:MAG TPA: hypothetical protein VGL26_06750 [Jatrophihabitans sp.]|jgi:hypothetical protein